MAQGRWGGVIIVIFPHDESQRRDLFPVTTPGAARLCVFLGFSSFGGVFRSEPVGFDRSGAALLQRLLSLQATASRTSPQLTVCLSSNPPQLQSVCLCVKDRIQASNFGVSNASWVHPSLTYLMVLLLVKTRRAN